MKKILFSIAIIGLILTTACGKKEEKPNNVENNEVVEKPVVSGPVANTHDSVIAEQTVDGLKINNVSLITEGESSVFTADVTNTNLESIEVKSFDIIMKDFTDREVITMSGNIGSVIEPNETLTMSTSVEMDLTSVFSIEYIRK